MNRETRKSRGFGFVTFHNDQATDHVLAIAAKDGHKIDTKQVSVRS